jgi:hypothetical protein
VEHLIQQHGMACCKTSEDLNITFGMRWAWKQKMDAMIEALKDSIKAKCIHCKKDSCLIGQYYPIYGMRQLQSLLCQDC